MRPDGRYPIASDYEDQPISRTYQYRKVSWPRKRQQVLSAYLLIVPSTCSIDRFLCSFPLSERTIEASEAVRPVGAPAQNFPKSETEEKKTIFLVVTRSTFWINNLKWNLFYRSLLLTFPAVFFSKKAEKKSRPGVKKIYFFRYRKFKLKILRRMRFSQRRIYIYLYGQYAIPLLENTKDNRINPMPIIIFYTLIWHTFINYKQCKWF